MSGTTMKYAAKGSKKGFGLGKALALVLSAAVVAGGVVGWNAHTAKEARLQAEAEAAAKAEAIAAAAAAYSQERSAFSDLVVEGMAVESMNASELSVTFHDQWEERKEASSANTGGGWVSPATGVFNASAYGYSGADQISYWRGVNSDVVGWLRVPGTNINWPIVQNIHDVNYYTHLGYDKQYSYNGVIWTNPTTRTSSSASGLSSNTVIYGHNWTNYGASPRIGYSGDVMFAQLTGFHWLSMAQSYPYFYYSTAEGGEFTVKIFACFYTELAFNYIASEGDMNYIINEARRRSRHTFDVDVNASDKIVTLSTCTRAYGRTSNQRFVVMGRVLRPGESIGPVTVTANPNHKQPSVW